MAMKHLVLLLMIPFLSNGQSVHSSDTVKSVIDKKLDWPKISINDVKWAKAKERSFWFYYKPANKFFESNEFEAIPLENGDMIVFLNAPGIYLLLPGYDKVKEETEQSVELASTGTCIFIKSSRGKGFWIFDRGKNVDNLERIGINNIHQYVYRSRRTDKRYWIEESDFLFGKLSTAIGILSE